MLAVDVSVSYLDCRFSGSRIILYLEILPTFFNAVAIQCECIALFTRIHTHPEVNSKKKRTLLC